MKIISKGETNFKYNFKLEDLLKTYMQLFEFKVGIKYRRLFSMTSL